MGSHEWLEMHYFFFPSTSLLMIRVFAPWNSGFVRLWRALEPRRANLRQAARAFLLYDASRRVSPDGDYVTDFR